MCTDVNKLSNIFDTNFLNKPLVRIGSKLSIRNIEIYSFTKGRIRISFSNTVPVPLFWWGEGGGRVLTCPCRSWPSPRGRRASWRWRGGSPSGGPTAGRIWSCGRSALNTTNQYYGSKYIEFGSGFGSRILAQLGSGSGSGTRSGSDPWLYYHFWKKKFKIILDKTNFL